MGEEYPVGLELTAVAPPIPAAPAARQDVGFRIVMAGLWAKKLKGISVKPFYMIDITGQFFMGGRGASPWCTR